MKEKSIEELLAKKNHYFEKAITDDGSNFLLPGKSIQRIFDSKYDQCFVFKMNKKRHVTLETKDFKKETKDSYPKFHVIFMNSPTEQYMLIEERAAVGMKSENIAKSLISDINQHLAVFNLVVEYKPQFSLQEFWEIISQNSGRISRAKFELITPNMANISAVLSEDFKNLAKSSNATTTTIELVADKKTALDLSAQNPYQSSLAAYASQGGGNISLSVKGKKNKIATKPKHRTIELQENVLLISGVRGYIKRLREALNV